MLLYVCLCWNVCPLSTCCHLMNVNVFAASLLLPLFAFAAAVMCYNYHDIFYIYFILFLYQNKMMTTLYSLLLFVIYGRTSHIAEARVDIHKTMWYFCPSSISQYIHPPVRGPRVWPLCRVCLYLYGCNARIIQQAFSWWNAAARFTCFISFYGVNVWNLLRLSFQVRNSPSNIQIEFSNLSIFDNK